MPRSSLKSACVVILCAIAMIGAAPPRSAVAVGSCATFYDWSHGQLHGTFLWLFHNDHKSNSTKPVGDAANTWEQYQQTWANQTNSHSSLSHYEMTWEHVENEVQVHQGCET